MRQAKIGNELYVYDLEPYVIELDIEDVVSVYVQEEKYDDFKALNPSLPLKKKNYLLQSIQQPVWYETMVAPDPDTVTISVDTSSISTEIAWDATGYALTAREFTTSPDSYASSVVITVDGEAYSEGMELQAGIHTVLYSLARTASNFAASASYSVVVTQEATPDTVTISIDDNTVNENITWDSLGYALTAKSFTTSPAEYASGVVITVDGNAYLQGMLLQAGTHTVLYSLAAGAHNFAASASYSVVITQDATPDTVTINVNTDTVSQEIEWDSLGYALTAKEFTTSPASYASSVVITVDGNAYSQGMLLQAGTHTVLYSLAATDDNFAASASYSVVITQDATPDTVTISINDATENENITWDSSGYALTAKEFTTSPAKYASSVVITVDGNAYSQGMQLQAGTHTVLYSLAATSDNFAASASYSVVITQDATPTTVTITVDTTPLSYNLAYNSAGYALTAREYSTSPSSYYGSVVTTVDGNEYSQGMLLQAGSHTVDYNLAATAYNFAASAYYPVTITQDAEPATVTISVDQTTVNGSFTYGGTGYALTAKSFTTSPTGFENDVVITVDGNEYSQGMLLQAGTHSVLYSLPDSLIHYGATNGYDVEVSTNPIQTSISVDTTTINETISYSSSGYALTAKQFATSPTGFENDVVITVDGNTYSQGMLLQEGTHTVLYSLATTSAHTSATAQYSVVISRAVAPAINVDTSHVDVWIDNSNSWEIVPKSFTTTPAGRNSYTTIYIQQQGEQDINYADMDAPSLGVGEYTILYSMPDPYDNSTYVTAYYGLTVNDQISAIAAVRDMQGNLYSSGDSFTVQNAYLNSYIPIDFCLYRNTQDAEHNYQQIYSNDTLISDCEKHFYSGDGTMSYNSSTGHYEIFVASQMESNWFYYPYDTVAYDDIEDSYSYADNGYKYSVAYGYLDMHISTWKDSPTINVDTTPISYTVAYGSSYQHTIRTYTTTPANYASSVVVTLDGNAVNNNQTSISAGSHTVNYSIAATSANNAASAYYSIVVTEESAPVPEPEAAAEVIDLIWTEDGTNIAPYWDTMSGNTACGDWEVTAVIDNNIQINDENYYVDSFDYYPDDGNLSYDNDGLPIIASGDWLQPDGSMVSLVQDSTDPEENDGVIDVGNGIWVKANLTDGNDTIELVFKIEFDISDDSAAAFLERDCVKYGFVRRYTEEKEDITKIKPSRSLYRYVSKEHAVKLRSFGMCLEEYEEYLSAQGAAV